MINKCFRKQIKGVHVWNSVLGGGAAAALRLAHTSIVSSGSHEQVRKISLPMQLCMTLTRSEWRTATEGVFTWAPSTDASSTATGVWWRVRKWHQHLEPGASSAELRGEGNPVMGPVGDVTERGRSCKVSARMRATWWLVKRNGSALTAEI